MHIETDRLIVRDLTMDDLDRIHFILDRDFEWDGLSRDERARWLQWTVLDYEQRTRLYQPGYGERGVALKSTGELIGAVGLVPSLSPFGLLPGDRTQGGGPVETRAVPEVGLFWVIASAHRGNGYAAEAAQALIATAFNDWKVRRVVATTEFDNDASMSVMRKLGMRLERNPNPAPFWLQMVGILDNPDEAPVWPDHP